MGMDDESEREGNCILMVCRRSMALGFLYPDGADRYEAGVVLFFPFAGWS